MTSSEAAKKQRRVEYDCTRCPAYCCTYTRIAVEPRDIARLAKRFEILPETARRRFTEEGEEPGERVLRHQKDPIFGTACAFLDLETRRCTVYEHRPGVCKSYPETVHCGYYDMLRSERSRQGDPELVIRARVL
jgi:Fe-S-cluster containining protein